MVYIDYEPGIFKRSGTVKNDYMERNEYDTG
jgi:hypothetical protein